MTATVSLGAGVAHAATIRVQSTTDTVDAGLVDDLLKPAYLAAQPGDTLNYVGVGTGAALTAARAGSADVVITHAPSLERQFVTDGFSLEPQGRAIFYSDYVIVGPLDDPAHVLANHPHDAIGAFEDIAAAGAAGTADFLSRANNSGTSVQEEMMWGLTSSVPKATAFDAAGDTTRFEPTVSGSNPPTIPPWYHHNPTGQANNVNNTSACPTATFSSGKCYTLVDRGTFNRLVNAGTVTNLKIVSEKNLPSARGGQDLLINPFSLYILNPDKTYPNSVTPNSVAATRLADFMTSPAFQTAVDSYPNAIDPAFHSDAFAKVTLTTPLSPTALVGSTVAINATVSNKLPGAPSVSAAPVQLQKSTDGGATYTNVGAAVNTSAAGAVSFSPTIDATTSFRLSLMRTPTGALSPNAFSPSTQDIGVVSAVRASTTPPPPPPGPKDTTAPKVSSTRLSRHKLSLVISEAGIVKAAIAKRVTTHPRRNGRRVTKVTYKTVKNVTITAKASGKASKTWKLALSAGNYRLVLQATDLSANVSHRTVHPHVK